MSGHVSFAGTCKVFASWHKTACLYRKTTLYFPPSGTLGRCLDSKPYNPSLWPRPSPQTSVWKEKTYFKGNSQDGPSHQISVTNEPSKVTWSICILQSLKFPLHLIVPQSYISFYLLTSRDDELTTRQGHPRQSSPSFPLTELNLMTQPIEDFSLGQDGKKNIQKERFCFSYQPWRKALQKLSPRNIWSYPCPLGPRLSSYTLIYSTIPKGVWFTNNRNTLNIVLEAGKSEAKTLAGVCWGPLAPCPHDRRQNDKWANAVWSLFVRT